MCKFNISNEKKNRNSGLKWANYSSNISWGREKDGEKKKMSKVSFLFLGDVSAVATCRLISFDEFSC
jgi:hypothetical protein